MTEVRREITMSLEFRIIVEEERWLDWIDESRYCLESRRS